MKKYTAENGLAKKANDKRNENSKEIVNELKQKYGYIDNEMMAAVVASFSNNGDKSIKGCEGMKQQKAPISSVRVIGKNGNMLSVIATDINGNHRSGNVDRDKLFDMLEINQINHKDAEQQDKNERE